MSKEKGKLIVFEGGEGCGKSTMAKKTVEWLNSIEGINAIKVREPGCTYAGEQLRNILVNKHIKIDSLTELLLFEASRRELYLQVIKPALDAGNYVICDRFTLSTMVYQGIVGECNKDIINMLNKETIDDTHPDATIILDTDPKIAKSRMETRKSSMEKNDLKDEDFHNKIRNGFISHEDDKDHYLINTDNDDESIVFKQIKSIIIDKVLDNHTYNNELNNIIRTINVKIINASSAGLYGTFVYIPDSYYKIIKLLYSKLGFYIVKRIKEDYVGINWCDGNIKNINYCGITAVDINKATKEAIIKKSNANISASKSLLYDFIRFI